MAALVNLLKTIQQTYNFQRFYSLLLMLVLLLILVLTCGFFVDEAKEEYAIVAPKLSYVKSLKANKKKLEFIQKHKLEHSTGLAENCRQIINDYAKKYKMLINRNDFKSDNHTNQFKTDICNIELLSWHDAYIFEMFDKIQELSPGFVTIENFSITRTSNINLNSPVLKVQILCKLHYK